MVHVTYAQRPEALVDALIAQVEADAPHRSALTSPTILTPSRAVAAFLKLRWAERTGIMANLQVTRPSAFFAPDDAPHSGGAPRNVSALAAHLEAGLETVGPEAPALQNYLAAGGLSSSQRDARRAALALKMAQLYFPYALDRPDWLGLSEAPAGAERPDAWLLHAWDRAATAAPDIRRITWPHRVSDERRVPALYFFLVPIHQVPVAKALARLQAHTPVHVYALNPCLEFWEDAESEDEPVALRRWGHLPRQQVRTLNALSGFNADLCPDGPDGHHLLAEIQRNILRRRVETAWPDAPPNDASIQVFACPTPARAASAAVGAALARARAGAALDDICILFPSPSAAEHRQKLRLALAAFYNPPHRFIDVPEDETSRVFALLRALLELPGSALDRINLLPLLRHPLIHPEQPTHQAKWLSWCATLAVYFGASESDQADSYVEGDLYTWTQAARRLARGFWCDDDPRIDSDPYPPAEVSAEDLPAAAAFAALVTDLAAWAHEGHHRSQTWSDWAHRLEALVTRFVHPDTAADERDKTRIVGLLADLARWGPGDPTRPVSLALVRPLLERALSEQRSDSAGALSGGITIGALDAVDGVPFRHVFILGMSEDQFPAREGRDELDLRRAHPRSTDVSRRDKDLATWLHRLVLSRDTLWISFVDRDAATQDLRRPSAPVQTLLDIAERTLGRPFPIQTIPFRPDLRPPHEGEPPNMHRLRRARDRRDALAAHLGDAAWPSLSALEGAMPPDQWRRLRDELRLVRWPSPTTNEDGRITPVPYRSLLHFLEDPFSGWLRFVLRIDEGVRFRHALSERTECFQSDDHSVEALLHGILADHRSTRSPAPAECHERLARRLVARATRGIGPSGSLMRAELARLQPILEVWRAHLSRHLDPEAPAHRGPLPPRADRRGSALDLTAGHRSFRIAPETEWWSVTPVKQLALSAKKKLSLPHRLRRSLALFVDQQCLVAAGGLPEDTASHARIGTADGQTHDLRLEATTRSSAEAYLSHRLTELTAPEPPLDLPLHRAYLFAQADADGASSARLRALLRPDSSLWQSTSKQRQTPSIDEARALIAERYASFFPGRKEAP